MKVNIYVHLSEEDNYYAMDYALTANYLPRIGEEILIGATPDQKTYTSYFNEDTRRWIVVERIVHDVLTHCINLYVLDITDQIRAGQGKYIHIPGAAGGAWDNAPCISPSTAV